MRGLVTLLLRAKNSFKLMYPVNGSRGILATSTPKKQENNESGEMGLATKEMADPIVAYSRPPPLPPVIGPLVALSLLDTWWNRSRDDDG
ncbi:hypothetical protein TSUD_230360 [Trifolium subterraneum]|nr:hypothetical protein TSUD_230360 [Trifolium subterraneum]